MMTLLLMLLFIPVGDTIMLLLSEGSFFKFGLLSCIIDADCPKDWPSLDALETWSPSVKYILPEATGGETIPAGNAPIPSIDGIGIGVIVTAGCHPSSVLLLFWYICCCCLDCCCLVDDGVIIVLLISPSGPEPPPVAIVTTIQCLLLHTLLLFVYALL